jgi:hypothetical protein
MLRKLGPVFDVDCVRKHDSKGIAPSDHNDFARLISLKLSRCLLVDPAGLEKLLFHKVRITTEELAKAGVTRLNLSEDISLSVLLSSIAGFSERDGKQETRLVILIKETPDGSGTKIAAIVATEDARSLIDKVTAAAKQRGN